MGKYLYTQTKVNLEKKIDKTLVVPGSPKLKRKKIHSGMCGLYVLNGSVLFSHSQVGSFDISEADVSFYPHFGCFKFNHQS